MEAATSATIASLERVSFALSFDANNSIFSFCAEMYLFPEMVTYTELAGIRSGYSKSCNLGSSQNSYFSGDSKLEMIVT